MASPEVGRVLRGEEAEKIFGISNSLTNNFNVDSKFRNTFTYYQKELLLLSENFSNPITGYDFHKLDSPVGPSLPILDSLPKLPLHTNSLIRTPSSSHQPLLDLFDLATFPVAIRRMVLQKGSVKIQFTQHPSSGDFSVVASAEKITALIQDLLLYAEVGEFPAGVECFRKIAARGARLMPEMKVGLGVRGVRRFGMEKIWRERELFGSESSGGKSKSVLLDSLELLNYPGHDALEPVLIPNTKDSEGEEKYHYPSLTEFLKDEVENAIPVFESESEKPVKPPSHRFFHPFLMPEPAFQFRVLGTPNYDARPSKKTSSSLREDNKMGDSDNMEYIPDDGSAGVEADTSNLGCKNFNVDEMAR